jgi:hypothetical protein
MVVKPDTPRKEKRQHLAPHTRSVQIWMLLIVLSTILLHYNLLTTFLANIMYLPPPLYESLYDAMSLEGAGAGILYLMFKIYPPRLLTTTLLSLLLGGMISYLGSILLTTLSSSSNPHTQLRIIGSNIGGIALCTTILPLPERLNLAINAARFFNLYELGGINTIQIGCHYGAYPLALLHITYLPTLLLLLLLTITSIPCLLLHTKHQIKHQTQLFHPQPTTTPT